MNLPKPENKMMILPSADENFILVPCKSKV